MAHEEHTDKTQAALIDRAWAIADGTRVAVFITIEDGTAIARPMSAKADTERRVLEFLTAGDSRKARQATHGNHAATVFCSHGNGYASFSGTMAVSDDRKRIHELWSAFDKAWWNSADDPAIRLVTFTPQQVELWDGPNSLVAAALMLSAAVTGHKPKLGDHATLAT